MVEKASKTLTSKEEEHSVFHGAEHGGEALSDDEGEEHVAGHVDSRSRSACLQRLDLTVQTALLPFRPSESMRSHPQQGVWHSSRALRWVQMLASP